MSDTVPKNVPTTNATGWSQTVWVIEWYEWDCGGSRLQVCATWEHVRQMLECFTRGPGWRRRQAEDWEERDVVFSCDHAQDGRTIRVHKLPVTTNDADAAVASRDGEGFSS